jgi:hypothetical protein
MYSAGPLLQPWLVPASYSARWLVTFSSSHLIAIGAAEKSRDDQPVVTYQVISGAANGMYLIFEPTAELKTLDNAPTRSRARYQAMGEAGTKRFIKGASETIVSQETLLFQINPKMSYVSKEFAAGDPDFWTPKPRATSAAK